MTLHTPQSDVPHEGRLIAKMHADLHPFLAQWQGAAYIAESGDEALWQLAHGAGQFLVTIHLQGDQPEYGGGPRITDPVILATVVVKIMSNQGFDIQKGSGVAVDKPGSLALLNVVAKIRRRILSYRFTQDVVNRGEMYYGGLTPLVLPDGTPLNGYELRFTCVMQMEAATSDKWKQIDL